MKLTWERRRLRLQHPFNIARVQATTSVDKEVLLARIEYGGQTGWGEAAPSTYYKQSLDSAERMFASAADMLGHDPFALDAILDRLWAKFPGESAAIAAIDGALHDLCGRILGVPVWKWLGLDRSRAPLTSMTIGIDEPDVMEQKVREAAEYPILKIKVGTPRDDEILNMIRRLAPKKTVRVDANCGWTCDNVLERCRSLRQHNIELIEQPTPAGVHECLPRVREERIAPIIADESCVGYKDVLNCAGAFDGINIKLSKCGGIRRAVQMIHTARSAGMQVMLGCMVETSVGISAAAHLGPMVDYIDLDGHLLLANDPFEGLGGAGGRLTLTDEPGLGIRECASR